MRLFAAVVPPAAVLQELESVVAEHRAAWPMLRWSSPQQWHLTLAFFGEVDDGLVVRLGQRLERAARHHGPMPLALSGAGTFPRSAQRARVLWIGVHDEQQGMPGLAASVAAGARRIGVDSDDKPLLAHLTLARGRREPVDVQALVADLDPFQGTEWTATEIQLIRSYSGPNPRYDTLGKYSLVRKPRTG